MKLASRRGSVVFLSLIGGCIVQPAPPLAGPQPPPPGPAGAYAGAPGPAGVTVEEIPVEDGRVVQVQQGIPGPPEQVGCADGQREAFVDAAAYPTIAGCLASWAGPQSMRAPRTGAACGDDRSPCAVPGDACAGGWHVCGDSGAMADLRQISSDECEMAGGGRFSAAVSHCIAQSGCEYDPAPEAVYPCFDSGWCSEPVCCGADCGEFGNCRDGAWPDATHIPAGIDQGCGATLSQRAGGVLCCRD
jgi:hypothetical protein